MNDRWIPDLSRGGGVKYAAIADALAQAIAQGEVAPGDRLPPQRELAARLGVDLTTVTRAYETARLSGLIEARGRAGSFVRDPARPGPPPRNAFDAGMNMPPELPRQLLARTIARTMQALLADGGATSLQYQPAGGAPEDRAAGAALLSRLGVPSQADQVLVTSGGQHALHGILRATLAPGDAIACGAHVYPGLRAASEQLGIRLVPLAAMTGDALDNACADPAVKALYVVPTNDNPTAHSLSASARQALAHIADRRGLHIIEDDAYGPLATDAPPPLASLRPAGSWYIASTSKIISPALRVAFVRVPSVGAGLALAAELHETSVMAPPLNVAMVTAWIADGSFDQLVAAMRDEGARRQRLAIAALGPFGLSAHPQGYHGWLPLADGVSADALADLMRPVGLSVMPGTRFAVLPGGPQALRISLGGQASLDQIERRLAILAGYLALPRKRPAALI